MLGSVTRTSAFCTGVVVPCPKILGCDTSLVAAIATEIVPCETAAAVTRTLRLMTTVPVRELMTTRAGGSPGSTSRFSIMLMKATRWLKSCGARTEIETPSRALATSAPKRLLMALMMAVVVVKSPSRTFKMSCSAVANGFSTMRSTVAPAGTRAEVGTPMLTLEPAALASMPVAVSAPWASAYTSPSAPRRLVSSKLPPRRLVALPMAETLTSIFWPGLAKPGSSAVIMTAATFLMSMALDVLVCEAASKSAKGPSMLTPMRLSMVFKLWAVNDTSEPSPVPCKPTTRP